MKTLITVIMTVFLTVSFAQPAHALSSGDRDKIAIALGLAWLFSSTSGNHGDNVSLRENCRHSWNKQNCNRRNSLATQWERNVEQYMQKQNEYLTHSANVEKASAILAELEIYAQRGLNRSELQQKVQAERTKRVATNQMKSARERLEFIGRTMHNITVQYSTVGGNEEKLKDWAIEFQERFEDFDPSIAPWDQ